MGIIALALLAKLAKQAAVAGNTAYKYYTTVNRLIDEPTTEAALRELEQVVRPMSEAERAGFTVALAGMAKIEKQPERRQRQEAMLRVLPWGDAALKIGYSLGQLQVTSPFAQVTAIAAAATERPQVTQIVSASAPQHSRPAPAAPAPQPFKANKFEKYSHRGYDITFADIRRPVVDIWEEESSDVARMRRIDLTEYGRGQWITLRDWQNREVPMRARADGKEVWLLRL